jgi:hypothetical protein
MRASVGSIPGDAILSKTAPDSLANFQNEPQGSARRTQFRNVYEKTLARAEIR